MKPAMLCFSGAIGSGKTTVSTAVAAALGWPRASFGDHVRIAALQRYGDTSRVNLQKMGAELITSLGWESFCREVLVRGGWQPGRPMVVDGIRHAEAIIMLRTLAAPLSAVLVHLRVEDDVRRERLEERGKVALGQEHIASADKHSTEIQVHTTLHALADHVLDATSSIEEIVADIMKLDPPGA